jgi:hypothetical protein
LAAALSAALVAPDAEACGGCFHAPPPQSQTEATTQVTGHRMVLSLSNEQTTLYDQIEYAGSPTSFAWVLPIRGVADVGLSSDLLFNALDYRSSVSIRSPEYTCPPLRGCGRSGGTSGGSSTKAASTSQSSTGGQQEEVLVQETVGPFETVQLSSTDPNALTAWLTSHGYVIPADIQPLIDAYVAEEFNFLAMKLVPGVGVDAMRPVRVTTPGAGTGLPLRMVAAGTGVTTTVTLWIVGEGRYQPANFPSFVINANELVWNFDTSSSNYKTVRQQHYDELSGLGWLVESAMPFGASTMTAEILSVAKSQPAESGYDPDSAEQEAMDDLAALFGPTTPSPAWLTRLRAELGRVAFNTDLWIEAEDTQAMVSRQLTLLKSSGTPPCPREPDCYGGSRTSDKACAAEPGPRARLGWVAVPMLLAFLVMLRLKRRR